ncbi:nuclear transport factor 2 family protein [Mycolicibacterium peregrinum]|uniref:Nuclear transport factor 2 family protein n=1 Tax=Mycolicibacterium peregrinum TaxID=43304 RepID=A0A4Z0HMN4_MYCPR|nr:nuclear transport factor 2 family protein [Mycolicibacterium peregrinum]TGB41050.1 nuclear transport factor 2 family protein [Mycolicibacterium peregrinum]TGB41276.1 nuclear transport factor 2 family protein [Mycolicibacterium peregrinum]
MSEEITRLMETNLLDVFDQRDPQLRAAAITTTYADDVEWIDDEGVATGRVEFEAKVADLQEKLSGLHFAKAGPVRQTRGLGFLAWEVRTPDDDPVASGFDVAEISGERIVRMWTVLNSTE